MFKLIKILNSKSNAPEIISVPIDETQPIAAHALYFMRDGKLITQDPEEENIKFMPIESVPSNSGKKSVRGFIITEDMIFEAKVFGLYEDLAVGDGICVHTNDDGVIDCLEPLFGRDARIIYDAMYASTGKIFIAFIGR